MYVRTLRPPSPKPIPPPRLGFPWARVILIVAIIGVILYFALPWYFNFTAQGVVDGDLIPVGPIFRSRIEQTLVQCNDMVGEGQHLAVVTNFLLEGQYTTAYQKAVEDLRTDQISQSEGPAQARIAEASARQAYLSSVYDARKLEITKNAYEQTYRQGAIGQVAYEGARAAWQAAVAESDGLRDVWSQAQERTRRVQAESAQRVSADSKSVAQLEGLMGQVRTHVLSAPVQGQVVECAAQPQAIVEAGTPIYKIFAPGRAYVLAFFGPSAVTSLHVGDAASVSIAGISGEREGKIAAIYPTLSKLPDQLTRYFWQRQQWSEYRPVKIALVQTDPDFQRQLTYDAQVQVRITRHKLPWQQAPEERRR
jgi:multidrug resistance efflux pump